MKARMRELNIKMTELSEYIKVSRPTLYKYIESYESGDLESIPDRVVSLFRLMDRPEVTKEQVVAFTKAGSWNFFCPNFLKLAGRETRLEHDADDLIRLIAPRLVYVASGAEDYGAGPQGEFEAARRAGELWEAYGLKGLSLSAYPPPGTIDHGGCIGYFQRPGGHILASDSWMHFLDFTDLHGWRTHV